MINPRNLMIESDLRDESGDVISFDDIPDYDEEQYDLLNPKDFTKYIQDIKKEVRGSIEYRNMISYLRDYANMKISGSFENLTSDNSRVKIEIHHTPFALEDIVRVVYNKRNFYNENLHVEMVAKEVMELHYKNLVGLYPLTDTEHKMVHNGVLFIPTYKIFGQYKLFVSLYKNFIDDDMMDTLNEIENYSELSFDQEYQNKLLSQSNIYIDPSSAYQLPEFSQLKIAMGDKVKQIKNNIQSQPLLFDDDVTKNPKKDKIIELIKFIKEE